MRGLLIVFVSLLCVTACTNGSTEQTPKLEEASEKGGMSDVDLGRIEGRWVGTGFDIEQFDMELTIDKSSVAGRGAPVGDIRYEGKSLRDGCSQSLTMVSVEDPVYTLFETGTDCPAGTVRLTLVSEGELTYTFDLGFGNVEPDATGRLERVSQ